MTIEDTSLSAYGYQLLPLATGYLVDDNRKFDVSDIFAGVSIIVGGGELMAIENSSLSAHGYQLLPIATSCLVCYNREFDFQTYFEVFHSLLKEGSS